MLIEQCQHFIREIAPTNGNVLPSGHIDGTPQDGTSLFAQTIRHDVGAIRLIWFWLNISRPRQQRGVIPIGSQIHTLDLALGDRHSHNREPVLQSQQPGQLFVTTLKLFFRRSCNFISKQKPAFRKCELHIQRYVHLIGSPPIHCLKSILFKQPQHHVEATNSLQIYSVNRSSDRTEFERDGNPFLMKLLVTGHSQTIASQEKVSRFHLSPFASPYLAGGYEETFLDPLGTGVGSVARDLEAGSRP